MRRPDPAMQLLRALARSAAAAGRAVELRHEGSTPWASATFVGEQHRVAVAGDVTDWLAGLPDADLPMHGHYVASCAVEGRMLTILVLEE